MAEPSPFFEGIASEGSGESAAADSDHGQQAEQAHHGCRWLGNARDSLDIDLLKHQAAIGSAADARNAVSKVFDFIAS
jgi:hypothetical protein